MADETENPAHPLEGQSASVRGTKGYLIRSAIPRLAGAIPHFPYFSRESVDSALQLHGKEYKPETLNQYLYELAKDGVIFDAGRGWYSTLSDPFALGREPVRDLVELLEKRFPFLDFSCWSTQQIAGYGHHQLARFCNFIYVEREAMESVADGLREIGKTVYVDPGKARIGKNVKLSDGAIVVRPLVTRAPIDGHYCCADSR